MGSLCVGARVGILGGGQLGRMMVLAGKPLGVDVGILSPNGDDPAAALCDFHVQAELSNQAAVARLAEWADVVTIEIEHVTTDGLRAAELAGIPTHPSGPVLDLINDKLIQKRTLAGAGVPVGPFSEVITGYPIVQKSRRGGYDGRGVIVLHDATETGLPGSTYYETPVAIDRELAVIVARSSNGEERSYPVFEMAFDASSNICTHVLAPARVDDAVAERARSIALSAARALQVFGLLAVELFLTSDGEVLVNEVAPRPHNSGHLTIDCCETSQFEQHLRAITGAPLGSTRLHSAGVMRNLLGVHGAIGSPRLRGVEELLSQPGCHLHWYGKRVVKPNRKMGHITITGETLESALQMCSRVENSLGVSADVNEMQEP